MNHAPVALLDNERAFSNESQALPVDSVDDEYLVVERHAARHYGLRRAFPARQKLQVRIDRAFDILYLDLPYGSVREYWFDITSFYGRDSMWLSDDDQIPI